MSFQEHLDILKQGVTAWNRWREEHLDIIPDMEDADLRHMNLQGVNFSRALLSGADLRFANLDGALISQARSYRANFSQATLVSADLREAFLERCNFERSMLKGADIRAADLRFASLRAANLSFVDADEVLLLRADASQATLEGANLSFARMSGINLEDANLSGTTLQGTQFDRAILRGANLSSTYLRQADLSNTDLSGSILEHAIMIETRLGNVDLSEVKGLETVRHYSRSHLDVQTLLRSGGKLPASFLRGVGVPDTLLRFLSASESQPVFRDSFMIYTSAELIFVERLSTDLQRSGGRFWFVPYANLEISLRDGASEKTSPLLSGEIEGFGDPFSMPYQTHDRVLFVCSEAGMHEWGGWLQMKLQIKKLLEDEQRRKKRFLIPLLLDQNVARLLDAEDTNNIWNIEEFWDRPSVDFSQWRDETHYHQSFEALLHLLTMNED